MNTRHAIARRHPAHIDQVKALVVFPSYPSAPAAPASGNEIRVKPSAISEIDRADIAARFVVPDGSPIIQSHCLQNRIVNRPNQKGAVTPALVAIEECEFVPHAPIQAQPEPFPGAEFGMVFNPRLVESGVVLKNYIGQPGNRRFHEGSITHG